MHRFILAASLTVIALVAFAAAGAGIFLSTLDLNTYKETIATEISAALGRPVSVEGSIHHSLAPLGLTLDRIVILDDLVYGPEPFLVVDGVSLRTNIVPLLTGSLSIDSISIQRADLKLAVSATGNANWQRSSIPAQTESTPDAPVASTPLDDAGPKTPTAQPFWGKDIPLHFEVGSFTLHSGTVTFNDLRQQTTYVANLDKATLSSVGLDRDIPFALGGVVSQVQDKRKGTLALDGTARLTPGGDIHVTLSKANLVFTSPVVPNTSLAVALETRARYSHAARSLALEQIVAKVNETSVNGNIALVLPGGVQARPGIDMDIKGNLALGDIDIDKLAQAAETLRPVRYKVRTGISDTEILAVTRRTPPTGSAAEAPVVTPGRNPSVHIPGQTPQEPKPLAPMAPDEPPTYDEVLASPLAPLRTITTRVDYSAQSVRSGTIALQNVRGSVASDGATLTLPFSLQAFTGNVNGTVTGDIPAPKPGWHLEAEAVGVDAEKALRAVGQGKKSPLLGKVSASLDIAGRGLDTWPVLSKTLQGKAVLGLQNSHVIDALPQDLARSLGLPADIPVSRAAASFAIVNGVGTTNDITVTSSLGTAKGQGTVNLVRERMDLSVAVLIGGREPLIPLLVNGGFSSPAVSLDTSRAAKGILQELDRAQKLGIPVPKGKVGNSINKLFKSF